MSNQLTTDRPILSLKKKKTPEKPTVVPPRPANNAQQAQAPHPTPKDKKPNARQLPKKNKTQSPRAAYKQTLHWLLDTLYQDFPQVFFKQASKNHWPSGLIKPSSSTIRCIHPKNRSHENCCIPPYAITPIPSPIIRPSYNLTNALI